MGFLVWEEGPPYPQRDNGGVHFPTPQAHPTYLTLSPQPKVCHDLVLRLEHTGC